MGLWKQLTCTGRPRNPDPVKQEKTRRDETLILSLFFEVQSKSRQGKGISGHLGVVRKVFCRIRMLFQFGAPVEFVQL